MDNLRVVGGLNSKPIIWPNKGFQFSIRDVVFAVKQDKSYKNEATYAVYVMVYAKKYARFLDEVAYIKKNTIPSCPRMTSVPGSSDIAAFGQAWWMILKPDWVGKLNAPSKLDKQIYRPGRRLIRLGCSVALEESLYRFITTATHSLEGQDGLLNAYMPDGFITLSLGTFDCFYGFVFACHEAGKTTEDCYAILPNSGVREHYPESFDVSKVTQADIQTLYSLLEKSKGEV